MRLPLIAFLILVSVAAGTAGAIGYFLAELALQAGSVP